MEKAEGESLRSRQLRSAASLLHDEGEQDEVSQGQGVSGGEKLLSQLEKTSEIPLFQTKIQKM